MNLIQSCTESALRATAKLIFKAKVHAPEILLIGGCTSIVGGTVCACKATLKTQERMKEVREKAAELRKKAEDPKAGEKAVGKLYFETGLKVAKDFAPAVLLSGIGLGAVCSDHYILQQRNAGLAAAYALLDKGYKEYRARVADTFGVDTERDIRYGVKSERKEETVVDENGNEKKQETVTKTPTIDEKTSTSRYFTTGCIGFERSGHFNLMYLKGQIELCNMKLRAQGYLLLNEVYEMLGMKPTKAGAVIGWLYDEKNPKLQNFVSFGLEKLSRETIYRIQNSVDVPILLDFNCDGYILDGAVAMNLMGE